MTDNDHKNSTNWNLNAFIIQQRRPRRRHAVPGDFGPSKPTARPGRCPGQPVPGHTARRACFLRPAGGRHPCRHPDGPASCGPLEVGIPAATLKVVTNNLHGAAVKVFAATALIGHRCVVRGVEVEAWGAGFHGEGHERG